MLEIYIYIFDRTKQFYVKIMFQRMFLNEPLTKHLSRLEAVSLSTLYLLLKIQVILCAHDIDISNSKIVIVFG